MSAANAFVSYSHADENALNRLHTHLAMLRRDGDLKEWTDNEILAGTTLDPAISSNLERSDLFIDLISPDYLASDYCYDKEFAQATALANAGKLVIVAIILEPCDWAHSPFRKAKALPKDGKPISDWPNPNVAFLDVVTNLRKLLVALPPVSGSVTASIPVVENSSHNLPITSRRPIAKKDFDSIQKEEFADQSYQVIKNYFSDLCTLLNEDRDTYNAKLEVMDNTAFTCSVVNKARMGNKEAHITVRNSKGRGYFGNISFMYQRYAEANSSNGGYSVAADDYNLFLAPSAMNAMTMMGGGRSEKLSLEQAAEELWISFVKQAGIKYI